MSKCTNCHTEIEFSYCSRCGNKYVGKRLTVLNIGADFLDNFFAVDNSFISQMWEMLTNPKKIIRDYWEGYRRYYFSPGRFMLIATVFLGFSFLITKNSFLEITMSNTYDFISLSLVTILTFLILFLFSSKIAFWKLQKNTMELLVMNLYTVSFWTILFSLFSVFFVLLKNLILTDTLIGNLLLQVPYVLLILIWNVRCFEMTLKKRILFIGLSAVIFALFLFVIIYVTSLKSS